MKNQRWITPLKVDLQLKGPDMILLKGNKCVTQTFKNEVINQTYCTLNIWALFKCFVSQWEKRWGDKVIAIYTPYNEHNFKHSYKILDLLTKKL